MSRFSFVTFISILSSISIIYAEIDDSSFSNEGRYALLQDVQLKKSNTIDLQIQFVPPSGKKVNSASFVKVWEKKDQHWKLIKKYTAEDLVFNPATNSLKAKASLEKSDSLSAVEVEFIYCNKNGGGQCDMERYLTKIVRTPQSKSSAFKLKLKI